MDMNGEYRLPARREVVWAALNDPEMLKACIPGCQALSKTGDNQMAAMVTLKIGPMKASFNGEVRLENINAPESYTIAGEGKGGIAGFAKGNANVSLAEQHDETILSYQVEAQIGGKMAQLGARLIDSTARKLAGQFFDEFARRISAIEHI
ncbi:MAG: carbon monoxide dehydrogenase subunit G [Pseudaminobacter sp.]